MQQYNGQPLQIAPRRVRRISGPPAGPHRHAPRHRPTPVEYEKLSDDRLGEPSAAIRERVAAARERQQRRFEGTNLLANADMGPAEVREHCQVDDTGKGLLKAAMKQLHMSARAYDELQGSSPHPQTGAHHRRPGGE